MRVTHVITRLVVGGAQENTVASVLGLARQPDIQVSLISGPTTGPEGTLAPLLANQPGLLKEVPSLIRSVHPLHDFTTLRRLTKIFRDTKPDIVHTHSGKAGVLGRLAAAKAGVPIIIHTIHGPSFGPFQNPLANFVFKNAEQAAGRVTTHFVSVAEAMTRQYLAAGIGRSEQYTRIFSGFDLDPFVQAQDDLSLRKKLGLAPDDIVVGLISRLFKLKGHDDLIAVAPKIIQACPAVKFLLVGDGAWRERLTRRVEAAGLKNNFIFTGLVAPAEVPALVGLMNFLVHLSRREGLARALPQALAAGRPVIAYDCDGANEVCLAGETGFLVPPGDQVELTRRIIQLATTPSLRAQLGARGSELVRQSFSTETMVQNICTLYRHLMETRRP